MEIQTLIQIYGIFAITNISIYLIYFYLANISTQIHVLVMFKPAKLSAAEISVQFVTASLSTWHGMI